LEDLVCYFDGNYLLNSEIHAPIDNLGFTRGYGAYECFRSYGKIPFKLDKHINRLNYTCKNLIIDFPDINFEEIAAKLLELNGDTDIIFRTYVIDHPSRSGPLLTIICNSPEFHFAQMPDPFILKSVVDRRENHFKSTSYSFGIIETKKAKSEGFNNVLIIGEDGLVHELERANIFAVKDQTLYTPKSHCLLGITRETVLEIAPTYGYSTIEEDFPLSFLSEVDEVFATATIRAITPIAQIDNLHFNSHIHGNKLQSYFDSLSQKCLT